MSSHPPAPSLRIRRLIAILAAGVLGASCLILAAFTTPYYSSPSEVRPWAEREYQEVTIPTAPPTFTLAAHVELHSFTRTDRPDKVIFEFDDPQQPAPDYDPANLVPVSPDGSFTLSSGGQVRLAAIGVSYPVNSANHEQAIFDPYSLEVHPKEEWQRRYQEAKRAFDLPDHHRSEPMLYLAFDVSKAGNTGRAQSWIFDSRTHVECGSSPSYSSSHPGFYLYGTAFRRMHDGPVTIVSDFYPAQTKKTALLAQEGETLRIDEFDYEVRILRMEEVPPLGGGQGSTLGSGKAKMEYELDVGKNKVQENHTLAFLSVCPGPKKIRVSYAAVLKDGKVVSGGSSSDGRITTLEFPTPPGRIASFQVAYSDPVQRAVFEVKGIPGLPEENRNVANLFDVRIPYVTCDHGHDLRTTLEEFSQLKLAPRGSSSGHAGRYPMTFQDAKVSSVLQAYLEAEGYAGVQVDRKQHLIVERESFWDTVRQKLKSIWP